MNNDQLKTILSYCLDCGYLDLDVLDGVEDDVLYSAFEYVKDELGEQVNINNLMYGVFTIVKSELQGRYSGELEEYPNLDLDFYEGVESFHNFIDTSVYLTDKFEKALAELNILQEVNDYFVERTGFSLT